MKREESLNNALIDAVKIRDIGLCKEIIDKHPDAINAVDRYGQTAFHIAVSKGRKEVRELLIDNNPDAINAVSKDGQTALHFAAENGRKEVCKLLIDKNPDAINAVTEYGKTALHFAASNGRKEVCELLIPKMTQDAINAVTTGHNGGKTALHIAAENGMKEVCIIIATSSKQKTLESMNTSDSIKNIICALIKDLPTRISNINDKSSENIVKPLFLYQDVISSYPTLRSSTIDSHINKNYFSIKGVCKNVPWKSEGGGNTCILPDEIIELIISDLQLRDVVCHSLQDTESVSMTGDL